MAQTKIYPPVLESKAYAFSKSNGNYEVIFQMPSFNEYSEIGHIQVSIKYKESGRAAVNREYAPDGATLFYRCVAGDEAPNLPASVPTNGGFYYDADTNLYHLYIPKMAFEGGSAKAGYEYLFQIRFGSNHSLWATYAEGTWASQSDGSFLNFAGWRSSETSKIPSGFGEWSNTQVAYCYTSCSTSISVHFKDFVPTVRFNYVPDANFSDPLEQVKIVYRYENSTEAITKSEVFNGQRNGDGTYSVEFKLNVAPLTPIRVSIEGVTKHNCIVGQTTFIDKASVGNGDAFTFQPINGEVTDFPSAALGRNPLTTPNDWMDDGFNGKIITLSGNTGEATMNVYRFNILSLDTVKVAEDLNISYGIPTIFKDYSCEMGERVQYVFAITNNRGEVTGILHRDANPRTGVIEQGLYPRGIANWGYAQNSRLDSVYLTSKFHQLRLSGNVKISAFKRNTNDNFQATIGSPFPVYSRNARTNYRTLTLSGLISIDFDPTSTFFRNDLTKGLWYDEEDGVKSEIVLLNEDMFLNTMVPRHVYRCRAKSGAHYILADPTYNFGYGYSDASQSDTSNLLQGDAVGPMTIYDEYAHRDITRVNLGQYDSNKIYMERMFRDYVMKWLSNGKPKLFRSETEGNMIVMTTGASFTPDEKSHRLVYNVSMTVTEIAAYNYENLIKYDLLPTSFESTRPINFPQEIRTGDIISGQDYRALAAFNNENAYNKILILANGVFTQQTQDGKKVDFYKLTATSASIVGQVNELIRMITDYSFIRGVQEIDIIDYRPQLLYASQYNVPIGEVGIPIVPIDFMGAVIGGSGQYEFSVDNNANGLYFVGSSLVGTPTTPMEQSYITIRCHDKTHGDVTTYDVTREYYRGKVYGTLTVEARRRASSNPETWDSEATTAFETNSTSQLAGETEITPLAIFVKGGVPVEKEES